MSTRVARAGTLLWISATLLISRPAQARQEYPGEVQAVLGMECPPPCTTCHRQPTGGKNWNSFGIQFLTPLSMGRSWADILAVEPLAAWLSVGALAALGLLRARSRRRA